MNIISPHRAHIHVHVNVVIVPYALKFPSLQLTNKHKICPSCRMKPYKLPGETQSHGSFSGHNSSVAGTHFIERLHVHLILQQPCL